MNNIYILLVTFLFGAVILGGCSPTGAANTGASEVPAVPLEATEWRLELLGTQAPIAGSKVTLVFSPDNQAGGKGGCNDYGGTYSLSGNQLTITEIASTVMACSEPPGVMEQEQQYLERLQQAASYKLEGNRLLIFDASGTTLLTFVTP